MSATPAAAGARCSELLGLDRSGPTPRADRAGSAAAPVDDPERRSATCGWLRSRSSSCWRCSLRDGRDAAAAHPLLVDRAAATTSTASSPASTGQYSRLGALLDPIVDRLHDPLRRRRLLALRAAAALGARGARRPRGGDAGPRPVRPAPRPERSRSTGSGGSRSSRSWAAIFWAMVVDSVVWNVMLIVGVGARLVARDRGLHRGPGLRGAATAAETFNLGLRLGASRGL